MFIHAPDQSVRYTYIQGAARTACQKIDPERVHSRTPISSVGICCTMGPGDKPRDDNVAKAKKAAPKDGLNVFKSIEAKLNLEVDDRAEPNVVEVPVNDGRVVFEAQVAILEPDRHCCSVNFLNDACAVNLKVRVGSQH
jgi:hypothetical protein